MEVAFERLLDWIEGQLSPEDAQLVEQEVAASDAIVQTQVRWLRAFVSLRGRVTIALPPEALRETLSQRFGQFARDRKNPSFFQWLAATLAFDSSAQPYVAGMRAVKTEGPRQLLYTTKVADIALDLLPHSWDQRIDILGQLLPRDQQLTPEEFAVQLLRDEREVAITMADELGEFAFKALAPGYYRLLLITEVLEIELPLFALRR